MSGTEYGKDKQQDIAMRVIADHIRTIASPLRTASCLPMLRQVMSSAVSSAAPSATDYTFLGQKQSFMYKLLPVLIDNMGDAYPELIAQKV